MNNDRKITVQTGWFLLIVVSLALFFLDLAPTPARLHMPWAAAQEKATENTATKAEPAAEKTEPPASQEVAVQEKAEPAAEAAAKEQAKEPAAEETTQHLLVWIIHTSGVIGAVILVLSIWFVAQVSRMFWELRPVIAIPPDIVARVEELIVQRDFKGVFELVKEDDSFFSRCLSTGIAELPNGLAEARDVMERVGESLRVDMEKKISMLAVLGTLGPMIGLLGTLKGMISSFSVIAMSGTVLKPNEVARGISEALLLTFEGVGLSVPAIYFFSLFRNRVSSIATQAMLEADQILRHFAHAARSKSPTPAGAAPKTPTKGA